MIWYLCILWNDYCSKSSTSINSHSYRFMRVWWELLRSLPLEFFEWTITWGNWHSRWIWHSIHLTLSSHCQILIYILNDQLLGLCLSPTANSKVTALPTQLSWTTDLCFSCLWASPLGWLITISKSTCSKLNSIYPPPEPACPFPFPISVNDLAV